MSQEADVRSWRRGVDVWRRREAGSSRRPPGREARFAPGRALGPRSAGAAGRPGCGLGAEAGSRSLAGGPRQASAWRRNGSRIPPMGRGARSILTGRRGFRTFADLPMGP